MSDLCPRHNCEPQPSHLGMFCPECLREGHFGSDADPSHPECVTPQDTTPPELKAILAEALANQKH